MWNVVKITLLHLKIIQLKLRSVISISIGERENIDGVQRRTTKIIEVLDRFVYEERVRVICMT